MAPPEPTRCAWAGTDPEMVRYHDREWGVPLRDERALFEFLVLETFQAGLSWRTVLHKRDAFRLAFDGFDPDRVARFDPDRIDALLGDPGIVRNRRKVEAAVGNARAWAALREEPGGAVAWLWSFVGGAPLVRSPRSAAEVPATSPESEGLSRALKRRGFAFVGPTVTYAFLQATGMVMDHTTDCFRHEALAGAGGSEARGR